MTDQYPGALILTIRDGGVYIGGEKIADLAGVINPDLIMEVREGQEDDAIAPLDAWTGEVRVPVTAGLLI